MLVFAGLNHQPSPAISSMLNVVIAKSLLPVLDVSSASEQRCCQQYLQVTTLTFGAASASVFCGSARRYVRRQQFS